jgi:CMP-N,N'-diacetyllegionaminic acid synthase
MTILENILVVIPARGGSKGLPGKNYISLAGKPLINYTLDVARELFKDEQICLSTDSDDILKLADEMNLEVPFVRPMELSTDVSSSRDVILHAIDYYQKFKGIKYDYVCLLQPTSPFRTAKDVLNVIQLWDDDLEMVISVCETGNNPYYNLFEESTNNLLEKSKPGRFTRRQDCPKIYKSNGAVYLMKSKSIQKQELFDFMKVKKSLMSKNSSIDIDDIIDLKYSQFLIENHLL